MAIHLSIAFWQSTRPTVLQCTEVSSQAVKVVGIHGRPSYLKGAKQAIRAIKVVGSMTQLAKFLAHLAVEL